MQKGASSAFEKADMREMKEITFETKKALILTTHPGGSYTLVKDKGTVTIKISNPAKFWSISRYLVVQID